MMSPLVSVVLSAIASALFISCFLFFFRKKMLDCPNDRSSHIVPTPSGGGLSFVFVAVIASLSSFLIADCCNFTITALPLLVLPLAIVGFLDDRYNLSSSFRYGVQLLTAVLIIILSDLQSSFVFFPLLIIVFTAIVNFSNFMDGLDGLLGGCMAVIIVSSAMRLSAPFPIFWLLGGIIGFLFWNWSPAKIFMGDVGSTFLGSIFAGLLLQAPSWYEAVSMLLVATPLLLDSGICVLRRLFAGHRIFQAHRLHLYQRLHQAGWPHAHVSSLYIAATAAIAIALLWGGLPWVITLAALELLLGIWLDQQVAVPFSVASRS